MQRPHPLLTRATMKRVAPALDPETGRNTAGFLASWQPDSPVVLHVPHAGLAWPDDQTATPDYQRLVHELTLMADLLTDQVADMVDAVVGEIGGPTPSRFQSRLSRLAMDPERFDDDTEEMNQVGMGVVYERAHTGKPLYSTGLPTADTVRRKALWYQPYSQALSELVTGTLDRHGRCLILDLHSYPTRPLAHELHKTDERPEICLGYEEFHNPGIEKVEQIFAAHGYQTARNQPYRGSYVPLAYWQRDPAVTSLMIEVRKDQYLDGADLHPGNALRLATAIAEVIGSVEGQRARSGAIPR